MEQYCAYENMGSGQHLYPYLINLQHPIANVLKHVLVAPVVDLARLAGETPPVKVCPVVAIAGKRYVVMIHMMAGLPAKTLGECVADLRPESAALRDAVEFLLNGY